MPDEPGSASPMVSEREAGGGLVTAPERAALLDRDAAAWPEVALDPRTLSDVELRLAVPTLAAPALAVPAPADVTAGTRLALRDGEGVLLAVLTAAADTAAGAPVSGELEGVRLPAHPDAAALRRDPAALRAALASRGWRSVAVVATDRALFAADLAALTDQLDGRPDRPGVDGVVVALLAGGVEPTDPDHHARVAALRAGLATLPRPHREQVLLTVLPVPGDVPDAFLGAVVEGYGLPGRDPVLRAPVAGSPTSTQVAAALDAADQRPAPSLEPAAVLDALRRSHPPRDRQGFTVFFTGLSGSGKSTVAGLLTVRLLELTGRSVLLLDGDRVRRHLSKGLGFGAADRNTNVTRIGWVAAQVSAAGGIAVCAPIAPFDVTRKNVRATVEGVSPKAGFVLVHIATSLEECERRDRKGLYAKARVGELPEFTGISSPYEAPTDAEVVADTTGREPEDVVDAVLAHLRDAGYLPAGG